MAGASGALKIVGLIDPVTTSDRAPALGTHRTGFVRGNDVVSSSWRPQQPVDCALTQNYLGSKEVELVDYTIKHEFSNLRVGQVIQPRSEHTSRKQSANYALVGLSTMR
jgi:hypothetical protein